MLNFEILKESANNGYGLQVNQICHLYGELKKTEAKFAQRTDPNVFRDVPGYSVVATEKDVRRALNEFANAVLNLHCLVKAATGKNILTQMVKNSSDRRLLVDKFDEALLAFETAAVSASAK